MGQGGVRCGTEAVYDEVRLRVRADVRRGGLRCETGRVTV